MDDKLVRGNYHIWKSQKKEIKKIAKEESKKYKMYISESEVTRNALDLYIDKYNKKAS